MHKQEAAKIAIVILNYHKAKRVSEGLVSLRRQSIIQSCQIVVVDNSVNEEQARILRESVIENEMLIVSPINVGYSRGINLGVRALADCDYVLLVNPDIIADDRGAIERLANEMDANPMIGILSPIQIDDDGKTVEVARRFPSLYRQFARRIWLGHPTEHNLQVPLNTQHSVSVDWVQSSFTLVRGKFWRSIGGLDERYFVFMSDVEIGHQAHRQGLDVLVTSLASVRSDGLRASRGGPLSIFRSNVLRIHLRDALIYHLRHRTFFGA